MDWSEKMNRAMDYIERNLEGGISYDLIAREACCSTYHLQRMFPYLTGVTLSEYIRLRRLTLAAVDLKTTDQKVIDIALKYGYEAPEAFSRAFKAFHHLTPEKAREKNAAVKSCPRVSFPVIQKGDGKMKYRITQRKAFQIFGVSAEISTDQALAFEQVPRFFRECDENGVTETINRILGRFDDNYTISALYDYTETSFRYMLGNFMPEGLTLPDGFSVLTVPASTWAVFDVPDCDMQAVWPRIHTEWFPSSGYEIAEGPQFEMYYGLAGHENGFGEIWIPVRK